jgi:penicillin amidase
MYGDAKGNIAWWATGKLYKHNEVDTHFILDGSSGKDDITEYMDFSKNPSAVNPNGTLYIQLTIRLKQLMDFISYYLPEDRAKRITVIRAKVRLDQRICW